MEKCLNLPFFQPKIACRNKKIILLHQFFFQMRRIDKVVGQCDNRRLKLVHRSGNVIQLKANTVCLRVRLEFNSLVVDHLGY